MKNNYYTYQNYLDAVFDIDYILEQEPQLIIEVTRLLSNFTLMASGNNKLANTTQNKLETLISYVVFYSFLVQSIKNAEVFLNSPILDEIITKILNTHPSEVLEGTSKEYEEHFYMLRNSCLRIIKDPQFSTHTILISNLIKTKKFREPNYLRGVINTALFIEKNMLDPVLPQYPFRFIQK